jgi:hypothetical protein
MGFAAGSAAGGWELSGQGALVVAGCAGRLIRRSAGFDWLDVGVVDPITDCITIRVVSVGELADSATAVVASSPT